MKGLVMFTEEDLNLIEYALNKEVLWLSKEIGKMAMLGDDASGERSMKIDTVELRDKVRKM